MNVETVPATATCQELADYFMGFVKAGRRNAQGFCETDVLKNTQTGYGK